MASSETSGRGRKTACPPHAWVTTKALGDVCSACGTTFLEHVRGFGSNTTQYEMPPSRQARKKSAVAKRFGQAFSGE